LAVYAPYVHDTVISFEERPPTEHELAARMERYTQTHPWLIAEDRDSVLGFAYGAPHRERAAYRWAVDVSVYVDGDERRRGLGRALYTMLLEQLEAQGFHVACAGITLPNDASVAIHELLGFELVGIYRGIGYKFGAWHDVGWWQLQLIAHGEQPPAPPGPPLPPPRSRPSRKGA
jgi:phosphinothricin acetyltransferase